MKKLSALNFFKKLPLFVSGIFLNPPLPLGKSKLLTVPVPSGDRANCSWFPNPAFAASIDMLFRRFARLKAFASEVFGLTSMSSSKPAGDWSFVAVGVVEFEVEVKVGDRGDVELDLVEVGFRGEGVVVEGGG